MPVNTPQLDIPVYQPKDMAVPQVPQGQPSQVLPAQAGFVPKSGAAAYVANNILQGWLKGREVAQQRSLAKAQNQMQGADYAYQTLAKNYNDLLTQGKTDQDPDVQKAKQAATAAWQSKLSVMGQYAMPEEQKGQKKSVKQKFEGQLGQIFGKSGITPQMVPQASLEILKNSAPPGLGLTTEQRQQMAVEKEMGIRSGLEQTEAQAAQLKLEQQKRADDADQHMQTITKIPEGQRTPEQKQWLDGYERVQHINDPEEKKFADSVMKKIEVGGALTDTERNFAYKQGLLEGPSREFRVGANGQDEMVSFSPDNKILARVPLGRHYEQDQVGPAIRLFKAQEQARHDEYVRGGMSDGDAWQATALEDSKSPQMVADYISTNPVQKEQDAIDLTHALRSLQTEAGNTGTSPEDKKSKIEKWSNFYTPPPLNDQNGYFILRNPAALKDGKFAGGMDATALASEHEAFINRLRAKLQEQHRKWSSQEIENFLRRNTPQQAGAPGAAASGGQQPGAMTPPPGMGWAFGPPRGAMAPPPPSGMAGPGPNGIWGTQQAGTALYTVIGPDNQPAQAWLTPAEVTDATANGARIAQAAQ